MLPRAIRDVVDKAMQKLLLRRLNLNDSDCDSAPQITVPEITPTDYTSDLTIEKYYPIFVKAQPHFENA
jgi:hypothetical protein